MLRSAYYNLTGRNMTIGHDHHNVPRNEHLEDSSEEYDDFSHDEVFKPGHLDHCFGYLRQSIMCAGDMSLEHVVVENGVRKPFIASWGVEHECRDWRTMYSVAETGVVNWGSSLSAC